jgi:uroporphyrinogen-III decarboxylase
LDGIACIRAAFPTYTVTHGTPAQIRDKVKENHGYSGPGRGYIFSTGYPLDDCPKENMEALIEAVSLYGKY